MELSALSVSNTGRLHIPPIKLYYLGAYIASGQVGTEF